MTFQSRTRTMLYYPTFTPPQQWLRQAILYSDQVGSIIPVDYKRELTKASPDIAYLEQEGEFKSFDPSKALNLADDILNELRGTVESDLFKKMLPPLEERVFQTKTMKIHWAKVSLNTLKYLEAQGLLSYDNSSMHPVSHDKWVFFEEKTGLLYMSILAKHISRQETEWTTPSTDESMYEALSFQAKSPSSGSPAVALHFFNALPIPRKDISFEQILKFKRKRQQELSSFREQLNSFEEKLRACQSDEEMSRVSTIFSQQIKREVNELSKAMSSDKLSLVSSSLKSIIELTQPALLTAAAGQLIQANPLEWMGGGFVVSASVRILSYIVDKRNARQAMFDKAPVAYLYYADKNKVF